MAILGAFHSAKSSSGVELLGEINYNCATLDESRFKTITRQGMRHYQIDLTANVRLDDEVGHLAFRVLHDGKELGKAEIVLED